MIQDIYPHRLDNSYHPERTIRPEDNVIIYKERQILVRVDQEKDTFDFPKLSDICKETKHVESSVCSQAGGFKYDQFIYLFAVDEKYYFLYNSNDIDDIKINDGCEYKLVRSLTKHPQNPQINAFAAFTAMHLAEWYNRQKFCSRCGHPLQHSIKERAMECGKCGYIIYPRLNPAVIVGVRNGDLLLLTKYRQGYGYNALVAGFVEIGETLEECVAREVMEETGLTVKNITYYKSQPWGIAGDLLAGFYCDVEGDDTIHMDDNELGYAEWVRREDIELQPANYSLTNEMMRMFKCGDK